jgi:hypothetical protein
MGERGRRTLLALALTAIALLFAGRWAAGLAAERWWALAVAPAATASLLRWHLLRAGLEFGGILVAGAWCVGHLLVVVRSIGTVQIPSRVGDLEIREALPARTLTLGAVGLGSLVAVLAGSGAGRWLGTLLLAWHGARFGVADPVLGLDAGAYVVQLPLWSALLGRATLLIWVALALALLLHPLVGSIRISQSRVAMTDLARLQVGGLLAAALAVAALREGMAPLFAIGAARTTEALTLTPVVHWIVAACWGVGALTLLRWTLHPRPTTAFLVLSLWAAPGVASRLFVPMLGDSPILDQEGVVRVAAIGTGLDHLVEVAAPQDRLPPAPELNGLWTAERLVPTLEIDGARVVAIAPGRTPRAGALRPVWLVVRTTEGGIEVVEVADDRLAPGGGPVSYRAGDPYEYPGVVSWREFKSLESYPEAPDSLRSGSELGLPVGGPLKQLLLAWGTQTSTFVGDDPEGRLSWRRGPVERVAHLVPGLTWGSPRPAVDSAGALVWLLDGWALSEYAPFAPEIAWREARASRYLRPVMVALVPAAGGGTRLFRRPDLDPVGEAWGEIVGPFAEPWARAPSVVRESDLPPHWVAVQGAALSSPPFSAGVPAETASAPPMPILIRIGPDLEAQVVVSGQGGKLVGLLRGTQSEEGLRSTLLRWDTAGAAPAMPDRYIARWLRFASFERLRDSVVASGGRVEAGPVRYQTGSGGTLAIQVVYLVGPKGGAVVGWVNVGAGDRIGAARTPAAAWANLLGESAPLVPGPEVPDRLQEARRWATLADSALRAGDLERFGRAFEALKRVLATP